MGIILPTWNWFWALNIIAKYFAVLGTKIEWLILYFKNILASIPIKICSLADSLLVFWISCKNENWYEIHLLLIDLSNFSSRKYVYSGDSMVADPYKCSTLCTLETNSFVQIQSHFLKLMTLAGPTVWFCSTKARISGLPSDLVQHVIWYSR